MIAILIPQNAHFITIIIMLSQKLSGNKFQQNWEKKQ